VSGSSGKLTMVPDERWPGMYRLRSSDGRMSEPLNLTRANDAFRKVGGEAERLRLPCKSTDVERSGGDGARIPAGRAEPLHGDLQGEYAARCDGVEVSASSPATALCRELVARGHDPDVGLILHRGDVEALIIASIGAAARVEASGLGYVRWAPRDRNGKRLAA
jgi:hypothetical protein